MREEQKRVIELLDSATPKGELNSWGIGFIPRHYKRLSVSMEEARELAEIGYKETFMYFGNQLYFTQALIIGAIISSRYTDIVAVTPSQYGKSWTLGQLGILRANRGSKVYVAGDCSNTTEIIMGKVMEHLQTVDDEVKSKLLEPADKIERLQTSLSKKNVGFKGSGLIKGISLGETFTSQLKGNNAIGLAGDSLIDEASRIGDDTYAELGRRQFASEDGIEFANVRISNPHNPGRFWDDLTAEELPPKTLVVWMDARTALEEERIKSKEQVINSEFFKNKSTCKRYLLCELEDYSEESLFSEQVIDDSPLQDDYTYFLGIDSAYKGKDKIKTALVARTAGGVRVLDFATIYKDNWVDGVTSTEIVNDITKLIDRFKVKLACVDVGFGVYIVEGLAQRKAPVKGINFGAGTTDFRKKAGHYSAKWGDNKRAEMHIDLQELMDGNKITFTSEAAEQLREEMNAVRAVRRASGGKTGIIPKDDIKRAIGHSPDTLDATLLGIHALLLHSMSEKVFLYQDE